MRDIVAESSFDYVIVYGVNGDFMRTIIGSLQMVWQMPKNNTKEGGIRHTAIRAANAPTSFSGAGSDYAEYDLMLKT